MTRRLGIVVCGLMFLFGAAAAHADEPGEVKLRRWYLGVQGNSGERDHWDVFGRDDLPPAEVVKEGQGGGFRFGYRFGGRFLFGLKVTVTRYDLTDRPEKIHDALALVTGTVLFRERSTLQPFLRGGIGGAAVILERPDPGGHTTSLGTAVVAGGGLQVRLSSRFSLEAEVAADFSNFLRVEDNPNGGAESDWRVKTSHVGSRVGIGFSIWF